MLIVGLRAAGAVAAAINFVALLGWVLELPWLASFGADLKPIAPSTAGLFQACGLLREGLWPVVVLIGVLVLGAGAGVGLVWRRQRAQCHKQGAQAAEAAYRELSLRLSRTEEEERRRIARELHDSTGQKLAALSMTVGLLQDATGAPGGKPEKLFGDCLAMIEQCTEEIRTLSYLLHPPLLDELGLAAGIRDYAEGFSKRSGVRVALEAPPGLQRFPSEVELALFRVVQESLGNIYRHAGASATRIRLAWDAEQVRLEVSDQGRGMSAETARALAAGHGAAGVGIAGMRERLRLLGGRLEIESGGQGTTVRALVPRRTDMKTL